MNKFLKKLPVEGILIIAVTLLAVIVILLFTKVDDIITSNSNIIIKTVNSSENDILFSKTPKEEKIIKEEVKTSETIPEEIALKRRPVRLYYIKVSNDGDIAPYSVTKTIDTGTTPLTRTLERLLEGPDTNDLNQGLMDLIPEGTKLLSISVKDDIAYLNFNDYFRFNPLGVEGYMAQIKQIVYTATEYTSVKSVQFLIEGSTQEYLGLEGVYIGRPISREDLGL